MEKILSSIAAALLPFLLTYFNKRNKVSIQRNKLEDAQKRIEFINTYLEAISKVSGNAEVELLKYGLANELQEIKNNINILFRKENVFGYDKFTWFQKAFLTFKPISPLGWLWHILFYLDLVFLSFAFLGIFVDEQNNLTYKQFLKSITDPEILLGITVFIFFLLSFRWLAVKNYRSKLL